MLIDAHCHLDRYKKNLAYTLEQIKEHRIFTISNSMDLPSYKRNVEIAATSDFVLPVFGIHPWNASEYVGCLEDLDWAISESPVIGEIGLDYYFVKETSRYDDQREVFEHFLRAASRQKKIVIVHTKGAERETLQLLKKYNTERVIIHWYSGPWHILKAMVENGFCFTIGVEVLFSQHIQDIARYLPAELMLTETDNPGGNASLTGNIGIPLLIKDIIRKLAEIRGNSDQVIMTTVHNNLIRLGDSDPWLARVQTSSG
ncbi:MAG TPA: TatD family hydrolase [Dehalococcoidia bacterium]|nr:TatD family hydrolase [Dehalococcoidia bacterium]